MKELNNSQLENLEGGSLLNCGLAVLWGSGAIAAGILGGPAGIGVGYLALGMSIGFLSQC